MKKRIVSLDCESNGLHGQVFAVAISVQEYGYEVSSWTARCPISGPVDPWVNENVIPMIDDIPVTHTYEQILLEWRERYAALKESWHTLVCHVPWPVETQFLWEAHRDVPFSGPFPIIDIASMLFGVGSDPTELDAWLLKKGIEPPSGSPHDPLYDARQAAKAYWALCQ